MYLAHKGNEKALDGYFLLNSVSVTAFFIALLLVDERMSLRSREVATDRLGDLLRRDRLYALCHLGDATDSAEVEVALEHGDELAIVLIVGEE